MENRNPIVEALKGVTDYVRNLEEEVAHYKKKEEWERCPTETGRCTMCGYQMGRIHKFIPFGNSFSVTVYLCDECSAIVCKEYQKFWEAINQKGVE